jgi:site-specific DNA-methyltransferase (adenine-specific)
MRFTLHHGDCLKVLKTLPSCSVDAIVTDPPAGIAFMGKEWDTDKGGRDAWIAWMQSVAQECLRVIKHGGHALVWALPRTSHWTAMAWENAGWEPRDKVVHLFGTGFPKSLNVGGGLGTALKPAAEDWWLLRKPIDGTIAGNVAKHGTGALNIDGCRIAYGEGEVDFGQKQRQQNSVGAIEGAFGAASLIGTEIDLYKEAGRWPANAMHDGSDEVLASFQSGEGRFFYCAKASRQDREEGCGNLADRTGAEAVDREAGSAGMNSPRAGASRTAGKVKNHHPTVKHTELMRYLCRLITPPNGVVLDAFMGSGSTGKACMYEGFGFIGIEQDADYLEIAKARIEFALNNAGLATTEVAVRQAPKSGKSLSALRKKVSDEQIGLFEETT